MFRRRHLFWILPFSLLVLLLLVGVVADSWLESSGGRQMLQAEMSRSMGLPVRLKGDYSLRLFPRLEIAGEELEIGRLGGLDALAFGKEYSAVIELAPFVHREVKISSIRLRGGFLDLRRWSAEAETGSRQADAQMSLPQVAALEIEDFYIRLQREEQSLFIDRLLVTGFRQGQESDLDLQARLMNARSEVARMSIRGGLTLAAGSLSSRLTIREMTLSWGKTAFEGLRGHWEWDQPAANLAGEMLWDQGASAANVRLDLEMGPVPSGAFLARYQGPLLADPASLAADFYIRPGDIGLKQLDIQIAGQSLGGRGCLMLSDMPALHLSLHAESLDLDRIQSMELMQQGEGGEFPLELAVELHVEEARFSGAEASDVVVTAGPEPVCPGPYPEQ